MRVIRACHDLGIEAVAVYSEPDEHSAHVRAADNAVGIGPAQAKASYLRVDAIIEAALQSGCEAVHPGYGFLAENSALPRACVEAGLIFIGPNAEVMTAVGDKVEARRIAQRAGVPTIPGSERLDSVADAVRFAESVGYPVMLKAAAGGGGRGLRRADDRSALETAFPQAAREAEGAFGDGGVFIEKYISTSRHVEVQILADTEGTVVHLGERDCSVQRRRQKLVEESPAPNLPPTVREGLCDAAVRLAREVGYAGAGTVEFLVDPISDDFYFIEVNARIQVEHGVSELVTGVDIIGEQIRIASGEPLGFAQSDILFRGAAIEFRINAEDPRNNFMPSPGRLDELHFPGGPGVRVDSGPSLGDSVLPFYDSMIAKVLVFGRTRDEALGRARRALGETQIVGIHTTLDLQKAIVDWKKFEAGEVHTDSLGEFLADW